MHYIGIDIGGTKLAAGVVSNSGEILIKKTLPTSKNRTEIIKDIISLCDILANGSYSVDRIGVGIPGIPNYASGEVIYCPNLDINGLNIKKEIQKNIDIPIYIENDANCAGLAENIFGSGKGKKNMVMATIGTGVGGAIIIDGGIYHGFNQAAAEIGHMVIAADGEKCGCGRQGCYEAYASANALTRQAKKALGMDAKEVFEAARTGNQKALKVVEQYVKYVGIGIANLINVLQPEVVVIGGGICAQGDMLLSPLKEFVYSECVASKMIKMPEIALASLGGDAGMIGAAMLGRINKGEI